MNKLPNFLSAFIVSVLFVACASDNTVKVPNPEDPNLNQRTIDARSMTVEDIFISLPIENIRIEGWKNLSHKFRKELLQKKTPNTFKIKILDNFLCLTESFQNEDDPDESHGVLELASFRNTADDFFVVFLSQRLHHEDKHKADQLISNDFLQFEGKNWSISNIELPKITTQLFLEESYKLKNLKNDYVEFRPEENNPNSLRAYLMYDEYTKEGINPRDLMKHETYIVRLIWNGQFFELQRLPTHHNNISTTMNN